MYNKSEQSSIIDQILVLLNKKHGSNILSKNLFGIKYFNSKNDK